MTDDCPCKGKFKRQWHQKKGITPCERAKAIAREYDAARVRNRRKTDIWIPGTSILVEEVEEL